MKKILLVLVVVIIACIILFKPKIKTINKDPIEEYLISVIACEMPASYELEALKSQAVAARTMYYYTKEVLNRDVTNSDQCIVTIDEMNAKWNENFNNYYEKIKRAVNETAHLIVTKDNKLFKTFYFSTSNGHTNDSISVFKETGIDGVESVFDKESKDYLRSIIYTKEELVKQIGNFQNITILARDKNNNVISVSIDGKSISGVDFRTMLNLRSTDFDISESNNTFTITTRGYGHGVGMSQYGANYLAKKGKTYEEILKYYYGNIEIKKY